MKRAFLIIAALVLLSIPLSASAAYKFTVQIEGSKQGKLKGECSDKDQKDLLCGIDFSYEVVAPMDSATGQPSGKRQHKPVVITKEVGAASPQIFQALATNELLKSVLISFYGTNAQGEEEVVYTIRLTNARVSSYRTFLDTPEGGKDVKLVDVFALTFQRIEIESATGKTMAADDAAR